MRRKIKLLYPVFAPEYEAGLEREFQLEKGLVKGFKRVSSVLNLLM